MVERNEFPILVVDDDESLLKMIMDVLRHAGFKRLAKAGGASEAMAVLASLDRPLHDTKTAVLNEPGIIVLDVMLPDRSGFEFCKELKDARPDSMVLMMSGFDIENLNSKLIDSEADDFLTKPFGAQELVARIDMLSAKMTRSKLRQAASKPQFSGNRVPHIGDNIGDYMILDSLGWGRNSVIYKAIKHGGSDAVAIKLLTKYSMEFKEVVKRFEEERKVLERLSHPNIIKFIEAGSWDGCPFIVMEYIRGVNLEERLVADGLPSEQLALAAARQVASSISAMHKQGVIHRDIKLKNILFEPDNSCFKLSDFGIAKMMENAKDITCDGFIVGTPIYMAPEIFRGEAATVESDIYSYGATMYHFATGAPPFSAKRNSDMYQKHLAETPRPIQILNPQIPKAFDELICSQCMAKLPSNRPHSMEEIISALAEIKK